MCYWLQIILIKGTCRTTVTLKTISFRAILTLLVRPLIYAQMSDNILAHFVEYILSIPALIYHLETIVPDFLEVLQNNLLLDRTLDLLYSEVAMEKMLDKLKGTQSLALLGNLINLLHVEPEESSKKICYPKFTVITCWLFILPL